ncbi:hypothetical protein B0H17DRAFT_1206823 [Mycena rosella]|uniref:Uncharacterized protein n=1 Tax=Mycena rosella TaxID=1033263 RepID=A0AAD7D4Q7_MYCRO|nr:hypothetical protein B0H17DRAFT_1206823 [Mycena rosella]
MQQSQDSQPQSHSQSQSAPRVRLPPALLLGTRLPLQRQLKQRELELKEKKSWSGRLHNLLTLGLYLTPSMAPRSVALVLWAALAVLAAP